MKESKYCQSCAMPLSKKANNYGTEENGKQSLQYCNFCYSNGKFIEPNITYEQMIEKGNKGIDSSNKNKALKWIMKKSYPGMLKKADRWKNK